MRSLAAASVAVLSVACASLGPWRTTSAFAADSSSAPREAAFASRGQLLAAWNALRGDSYALDDVPRWLEPGQKLACDQKSLVQYKGATLRYAGALVVAPAFAERLRRFEEIAAETARDVYGREPRLIRHYGSYSCRSTRNRKRRVSEHALGNALDLVGFDFGSATRAQPLPDGAPKQLR